MLKNNKDFKTTHCYFYKNVKNKTTTIGKINFLRELILTLRLKKWDLYLCLIQDSILIRVVDKYAALKLTGGSIYK